MNECMKDGGGGLLREGWVGERGDREKRGMR